MDPSCLPSLLTGDIGGLSMCRDTREPIPRRSPSNVPGTVAVKHSADGKLYPPPLTCQYLPPNTSLPTYGTTCYLPSMCLPYVVSPAPCCNLPTCSGSPLALELSPSPATSKMSHPPPAPSPQFAPSTRRSGQYPPFPPNKYSANHSSHPDLGWILLFRGKNCHTLSPDTKTLPSSFSYYNPHSKASSKSC
jgi:hypothetical protein